MALSKSVADVIQENEFWIRLTTFLHEPLKKALVSVLHNTTNDPTYVGLPGDSFLLYQELSKHGNLIAQLVKRRVLQQDQVDLLLPPNTNQTDSAKFDVTLIAILIRNFTTLKPPLNGWNDKNPPACDRSKGASVIRGREWRNFVHHTEPKDIDKSKFNQKWTEGTQIVTDLGYQYDTNKLGTISLDPKHEVVLNSLFSFIANLNSKHDSHSKIISNLTQQLNKISNKVQQLHLRREEEDYCSTKSNSYCLKSVLEYISKEIKEEEAEDLLTQLHLQTEGSLLDKLRFVSWKKIKKELEMLGRKDIVEYIRKNFLITRGLQNASNKLREHYQLELINCLVEQPLTNVEKSQYASRDDIFIDLVVLPFDKVDKEYNNSDRDALMKQNLLVNSSKEKALDKMIEAQDELIFIRGVAGIGKTTLIDTFTFKWAKKELSNFSLFDFVFKFTCRELNQILTDEVRTMEQLFELQYQNIFDEVTLKDLADLSSRVLIIVDGVDELKDIYQMDGMNAQLTVPFLQLICELINPKSINPTENYKSVVCGRPKACELLKNQFSNFKIKTIEICGFSHSNVRKYVNNFFSIDETKSNIVQDIITSSYNLRVMSTVPVFLWVICNVYSEQLIKKPINTSTELYFYTCLIFLRNHFQGTSRKYKSLLDIVNDQDIIDAVFSLMVLSVNTYMQNQVLFTDDDIKTLKCPVHLEQTGFIIKYIQNNITKSIYQFRHLILQEFLCGMYLCVTKGISSFLSNRELSSCLPTILGIHRIVKEKDNEIFLCFYKALKSKFKKSNLIAKVSSPLKSLSYNSFINNYFPALKLPHCMTNKKTLSIMDIEPDCREFLDLFKETCYGVDAPPIEDAVIKLRFYKDFKNILGLLEKLDIKEVRNVDITSNDLFDESGRMDDNVVRLYEIARGSSTGTTISLYPDINDNRMYCSGDGLVLRLYPPIQSRISIPDTIKKTSTHFKIYTVNHMLCHDAVSMFLKEITKYAIDHRKNIWFLSPLTTVPSVKSILNDATIDIKNEYIHWGISQKPFISQQ